MLRTRAAEAVTPATPSTLNPTGETRTAYACRIADEAERADLPGLERVTEQSWASIAAYVALGWVPVAFLGALFAWWTQLGELLAEESGPRLGLVLGIGGVGLAALFAWLAVRVGRGDFAWKTGPEGIEARGLFRRRRLRWTEVTSAIYTELGYYHLDGPAGRISFTSDRLGGSAWQHLRRLDLHRSLRLGSGAASFWVEYPAEDLPRVWGNPARVPPGLADALANWVGCWLLFSGFLIAGLGLDGWGWLESGLTLVSLAGAAIGADRCRRSSGRCLRRCELTADGLRGETWLGPFELRWDEISAVGWQLLGSKTLVLRIDGPSSATQVLLPVERNDPAVAPLFLALLHRLRYAECPQCVSIPQWLLRPDSRTGEEAAT